MSEDIVRRLRALPPEMAGPGDRFDRVRARVLRRRRMVIAAAAAVTVVAALGVPVGLALARGGSDLPPGPAVARPGEALSCPRMFGGPQPWVPQRPTGVDGRSRLVPQQQPRRALVCAFAGQHLSGERVLSGGLDRLAEDLTWLPRKLPGQSHPCTLIGGPQTDYLIGLTYPDGTVWVSAAQDPNACVDTSNGEFTSQVNIGRQVAASYAAGAWVPAPAPPPSSDRDPCQQEPFGRLGQETAMVPPDPVSVKICKGTAGRTTTSFDTRTATDDGYRDLVDALNALPTRPSTWSCQDNGRQPVFYELMFRYAAGPPVRVLVRLDCTPAIDNTSLEAQDASTVLPEITRLLGTGS